MPLLAIFSYNWYTLTSQTPSSPELSEFHFQLDDGHITYKFIVGVAGWVAL